MNGKGMNQHVSAMQVGCREAGCADTVSALAKSGLCSKHQRSAYAKARRASTRVYNEFGMLVSPCAYDAAHRRVQRYRGKAREYLCAHGDTEHWAAEWAYNNISPNEQIGMNEQGYLERWSPDAYDYLPLCKDHHYAYDRVEKPALHNYIDTGMTVHGQRVLLNERANTLAIDDGKIPPIEAPEWVQMAYCYI